MSSAPWLAVIGALIGLTQQACDLERPEARAPDAMVVVNDSADAGSPEPDAGEPDAAVVEPITCAGSSEDIVFGSRRAPGGGGIPERGSAFQGWFPLFYVTADCKLYLVPDRWQDLRVRALSETEARDLADQLHVSRWSELPDGHCGAALGDTFWYRGREFCEGPGLPQWFTSAMVTFRNQTVQAEYDKANTFEASLWFTLVRTTNTSADAPGFRGAQSWPWGDPSELAPEDLRVEPQPQLARGDMAGALRVFRDDWLAGKIGQKRSNFVPIVFDGARYELRTRGATPLDLADGTLGFR